ncbi:MAG: phosphoadenylyl-sulfate reductase [Cyclobacteriaceae bacterium]|nr:phosphoadenylyl-sulfate reductase [Cyclobacteriaceae bacterium]
MEKDIFERIAQQLNDLSSQEGLRLISEQFSPYAVFSTSFGLEDQVITHWLASAQLNIQIFTIDTGRLFQETYEVFDLTQKKYNFPITSYFPCNTHVEEMLKQKGPNSFYESVENRKECCYIRKVEPLQRALAGAKIWVTGLRAEQSANRELMKKVEWDSQYQLIKYNPLLKWTFDEVMAFTEVNNIPINTLHKKGFPSIGCAPCTRAVLPEEDSRAGRWWWENSKKECGLHEQKDRAETV